MATGKARDRARERERVSSAVLFRAVVHCLAKQNSAVHQSRALHDEQALGNDSGRNTLRVHEVIPGGHPSLPYGCETMSAKLASLDIQGFN